MRRINAILRRIHLENFFLVNMTKTMVTFSLVTFGWILFRAETMDDSIFIMANLFSDFYRWGEFPYVYRILTDMGLGPAELLASIACIIILLIADIHAGTSNIHEELMYERADIRFVFYTLIGFLIIALGVFHGGTDFIYFQF